MGSIARSSSLVHLCMRAAYRRDHAAKLRTMHACTVARNESTSNAMLCAVLAHGRSEASKRVSGPVDVRASCLKVSMQCLLHITKDRQEPHGFRYFHLPLFRRSPVFGRAMNICSQWTHASKVVTCEHCYGVQASGETLHCVCFIDL